MTNSFTEYGTAISKWRRREGEAGYTQPSGAFCFTASGEGVLPRMYPKYEVQLLRNVVDDGRAYGQNRGKKAFGRKKKDFWMLAWLCGTALCAFQCSSVVGEFLDSLEPYQESGLPSVVMSFRIGLEGNGPGGKSPYCNK